MPAYHNALPPRSRVFVALLAVTIPCGAQALEQGELDEVCARAAPVKPPSDLSLSQKDKAGLANCDSVNLYYGIGTPRNFIAARQCALAEMEQRRESVLGGNAMLMVIYANGSGVPKNLPFALKLACSGDGAPAEIAGRVEHLRLMQLGQGPAGEFGFCDDATSGFLAGACTELAGRAEAAARKARLTQLEVNGANDAAKAYAKLTKTMKAFHEARVANEVDLSGTLRGTYSLEEHAALEKTHLELLSALSTETTPAGWGQVSRGQADTELNLVYKLVQSVPASRRFGTVTNIGIRDTQRLWLKYRDAWLAFVAVKFPSADRENLAAWLTVKRTAQLHEWLPSP